MKRGPVPGERALTFPSLLGLLTLVVGVPLNLYVTIRLWRLHRERPELRVLRERWITAGFVLGLTIVFGLIFVNNDTLPPPLDLAETKIITRLVLLAVAVVPALYWLRIYHDRDDPPTSTQIDANTAALDANTAAITTAADAPTDVHVVQHPDDPPVRVKPETEK